MLPQEIDRAAVCCRGNQQQPQMTVMSAPVLSRMTVAGPALDLVGGPVFVQPRC
jgi:hypothetical protein